MKKPITKDHILSDSIFRKCPEKATPQGWKVDQWLPGDRDGGGVQG